ncbi:MAG: NAD(P)H-dependent oxidoreductase [Acidimicrobiia bacterium]|nr:NAD(P)H-dependent oxidoreductase [Acidimicrobiia bacterium]
MADRPYRIPVLCGTVRKGARSAEVGRWVTARLAEHPTVSTQLIELGSLGLATDDEGTAIKQREFSELIDQSDGLVIVSPEYNHGYPASLKHALDTNYTEYVHKPVGLVGVSAGPFGGARMIENLLPVLRGLGLVPIQRDATVGNVATAFDQAGALLDNGIRRRIDGMLTELRWMAAALRYGRQSVSTQTEAPPAKADCPECGVPMNHHASVIDEEAGGATTNVHACSICGGSATVSVGPS